MSLVILRVLDADPSLSGVMDSALMRGVRKTSQECTAAPILKARKADMSQSMFRHGITYLFDVLFEFI
jgi:hypothetical protein